MKSLLVLNDAHNPINNPAVQIADPGKQNTFLQGNYITNRRTISHHDGNVCSYHYVTHHFFYQCIPRGIMVRALFCPICQILPVWFQYTMFGRLCCLRLTNLIKNCHSNTVMIFQHINMETYFKVTCLKSTLWPALVSNVVDVSLSGGSLGYWTACNNAKRYCTLPYCEQ